MWREPREPYGSTIFWLGRQRINNILARQAADQQYFGSAGGRRFLVSFGKIKSEGASSSPSETKIRALENYTGS